MTFPHTRAVRMSTRRLVSVQTTFGAPDRSIDGTFFALHIMMRARHGAWRCSKLPSRSCFGRPRAGFLIDWGNRDGRYGRKLPPQLKGAL
jgi:hypothetical protein